LPLVPSKARGGIRCSRTGFLLSYRGGGREGWERRHLPSMMFMLLFGPMCSFRYTQMAKRTLGLSSKHVGTGQCIQELTALCGGTNGRQQGPIVSSRTCFGTITRIVWLWPPSSIIWRFYRRGRIAAPVLPKKPIGSLTPRAEISIGRRLPHLP
jgi:hypothetical protein